VYTYIKIRNAKAFTKEEDDMKIEEGRLYTVKEWMANKIANEVGKNIHMCELFAVLKETEKAVYAMVNCGYKTRKCAWIPKSAIIDITEEADGQEGIEARPLIINDNYDEVVELFTAMWKDFE
jgi:predicted fused transcriptional regulator/phosphomethylpyrimidine kinase